MRKIKFLSVFILLSLVIVVAFLYPGISFKNKYVSRNESQDEKRFSIEGSVEYLAKMMCNLKTGMINPKDVLNARKQMKAMAANKSKSLDLSWQEVGPDNIGGRTRAILIDKDNPDIMYAGGVAGGLWKTTNAGASWTRVTTIGDSELENICVTCIVQAPNGDIYVGTGEGLIKFFNGSANGSTGFIGRGIYKSTDGSTFVLLPSTEPQVLNDNATAWMAVNNLACDPVTGRIYAATIQGLLSSDDGGTTWTDPVGCYIGNDGAYDVDVASDGTVITCINQNSGYISPSGDSGTFTCITTGAAGKLPNSDIGRIEFAFAPSDPDYIYASIAKGNQTLKNIYRSTDKGQTWTAIDDGSYELLGTQGRFANAIAVFPDNPDKIIVGGLDMYEGEKQVGYEIFNWEQRSFWNDPEIYSDFMHADHHKYLFHPSDYSKIYFGTDGGLFVSDDGGYSFQNLNNNYNVTQFYTVACSEDGNVAGGAHDNGTIYIDRQNADPMKGDNILGGDGGSCAISIINPNAIFASYQWGNVGRSYNKGQNYVTKMFSQRMDDYCSTFITPLSYWENTNDIYSVDHIYFLADRNYDMGDTVLAYSKNNSFPFCHILAESILQGDSVEIQDVVQTKFFAGGRNAVWMTKEILKFSILPAWFKISDFTHSSPYNQGYAPGNANVQAMSYSRDGNDLFVSANYSETYTDTVFHFYNYGELYLISNLSAAYDSANSDVTSSSCVIQTELLTKFENRVITSVAVDPYDANHIIVTLGNYGNDIYIYESKNALAETPVFTEKQGNLPKMPVYSAVIELNNPNIVIIGTEYGIFATQDIDAATVEWTEENTGMERVPTHMIIQQIQNYPSVTNGGVIYAATHGRGIFECGKFVGINEKQKEKSIDDFNLNIFPNPANDRINIFYTLNKQSDVLIEVYDLKGRTVKLDNLRRQNSGSQNVSMDLSRLANGTYFVQVTDGINSVSGKIIITR